MSDLDVFKVAFAQRVVLDMPGVKILPYFASWVVAQRVLKVDLVLP